MAFHRDSKQRGAFLPEAPALRILVYVDAESLMPGRTYGPDRLVCGLKTGLLEVHVDYLCREYGARLTPAALEPFDEVWFLLKMRSGISLTEEERSALRDWMNRGGGVMVAGDHAEKSPEAGYQGLGAHVGALIPRAGELRRWDAAPGNLADDSVDTIDYALADPSRPRTELECDERPQRLLLLPFEGAMPHPIFRDAAGRVLDRFPDHMHEGEVIVTIDPAAPDWEGVTRATLPRVIARGVDWSRGCARDLMAVWDGHALPSPRGRIVADASFHHYANDNLKGIVPAGGDDWRRIAALFCNLAAWLAPPRVKRAHRERAVAKVGLHERIADLVGCKQCEIGAVAAGLLAGELPAVWLHELIDDVLAESLLARPGPELRREAGPHLLGAYVSARRQQWLAASPRRRKSAKGPALVASEAAEVSRVLREALAAYEATLKAKQADLSHYFAALGAGPQGY